MNADESREKPRSPSGEFTSLPPLFICVHLRLSAVPSFELLATRRLESAAVLNVSARGSLDRLIKPFQGSGCEIAIDVVPDQHVGIGFDGDSVCESFVSTFRRPGRSTTSGRN